MIFKDGGVPIYSQCFGSFCARVGYDESLYSGFLSALTTMPDMFGDEEGLRSVEMGFTKLHFSKTTPSGHNICVGIDKDTIQDIDLENQLEIFYDKINILLEEDYKEYNWIQIKESDIETFEQQLLHDAIYPCFPYFIDNEICASDCPFDHDADTINTETNLPYTIIDKLKSNYSRSVSFLYRLKVKLLAWIYLPLYRWFDLRKYKNKRNSLKKEITE